MAFINQTTLTCNYLVAYYISIEEGNEIDKVFKALADSSRRKLLDELFINNGQTLTELCQHLDMSRQAVTKHLMILEEANLVVVEWHGRNKIHYMNPVPINEISKRWINKYEQSQVDTLTELKLKLEEEESK